MDPLHSLPNPPLLLSHLDAAFKWHYWISDRILICWVFVPEGQTDYSSFTEEDWRQRLTPEQFYVCRKKGTERAFTG